MKLLLADDDVDQLELRALTLSNAGYEICSAPDEKTALILAAKHKPQIAVVDLRLPTEEAGLRLIRRLKELDRGIRVIVLTGTDARRVETLPERALVEAVIIKGNASRQLLAHLMRERLRAEGHLVLDVKVTPRSSTSEVMQVNADGSMKVKLATVPEKGKANQELIALLADYFRVPKEAVELLAGATAERKRLRIRAGGST